jgi:hypothetical protein
MRIVKVPGEDGKAQEQAKEIQQQPPFRGGVVHQIKIGTAKFIGGDGHQTGHGDLEGAVMKHRNAEQRQAKQEELQRHASQRHGCYGGHCHAELVAKFGTGAKKIRRPMIFLWLFSRRSLE